MKAYFKVNPIEVGHVIRVYTPEGTGAKRFVVRFAHSTVDALATEFELSMDATIETFETT